MFLLRGNIVPDLVEERIRSASLKRHGHDDQMSCRVCMNEMHCHLGAPAVDPLLARPVKVELDQGIAIAANAECASGGHRDLDRVPIVDDLRVAGGIVEYERRKVPCTCLRPNDINRRLSLSPTANAVVGFDRTPVSGPACAGIGPVVFST